MSYHAYVTRIKNVRKHPNADRLQLGECFGNTVCVNLDYTDGQLGIYFPTDGQLSFEFADVNNLLRKKDEAGNQIGGYMDPDKRNVTAIRLRGEKSDGLFLPIDCLALFGPTDQLKEGDVIDTFNGKEICKKYIPRSNKRAASASAGGNRTRKKKVPVAPLFSEHADTEQLAYNLSAFKPGDEIEITLKMHGTSGRTAHLPVLKGYKRSFWDWLFRREGTPVYDYGYVSGTRRVVLENYEGGFYGDNSFRENHSKFFEGKLWKGETVYYEIVSYTNNGTPIMGECKTPKEAQIIYGKTTVFHYNVEAPNSDMYVYRMTMTNPDGEVVEYTPDFMRYRCEMMGAKCVPVMWKGTIPANTGDPAAIKLGLDAGNWIKEKAEEYYDGPDPIGKTHVREGVVVRILNKPKFTAYKHKNFLFKQITGIIKEQINTELLDDIAQEL